MTKHFVLIKFAMEVSIMDENRVFELRVPEGAVVKDVKFNPYWGFVAATMEVLGIAITFIRTDFIKEVRRITWDMSEVLSVSDYHEVLPSVVTKSIEKCKGIFISRDFAMVDPELGELVPNSGVVKRGMCFDEAQNALLEIPGMEASLLYGAVYDTIGRWLIATQSLSYDEWVNSPTTKKEQDAILDRECGNWTIRELFGDIFDTEWTMESYQQYAVAREGTPFSDGEALYPARKRYTYQTWMKHSKAAVRTMWSFKE